VRVLEIAVRILGAVAGFYAVVAIGVLIVGSYRAGREEVDLDW
jgi:hypothetical protein